MEGLSKQGVRQTTHTRLWANSINEATQTNTRIEMCL